MTPDETTAAVAAGVVMGVMVCAAAYFVVKTVWEILDWIVDKLVIRIRGARAAR